jgi:DNA polymerase-3 subunit beta
MKFSTRKSDILEVLSKIQGMTGRKSNLAITSNVLISTTDTGISITATDLETGFVGHYPAINETDGVIAINAKKIYEIVREFPSSDIIFHEVENRWVEINNHQVEYHIMGMNPDDFPELPNIEDVNFVEMDSAVLKKMIEKTAFITGEANDKRAHINGVYLTHIQGENDVGMRLVSTDGRRLSKVDGNCSARIDFETADGVLVPKKGMNEVAKFLDMDGTVQVGVKNNQLIVKKESEIITVRLLEGDFPNFKDLILVDGYQGISIERQSFLMMLKRMSILSSEEYKGVVFHFKNETLTISTTNPDIGESKEDIGISFSDPPFEVAFNPKYFIDSVNMIGDENVVIHIKDKEHPCLINGEKDASYLSVIMPMRI